MNDEALGALLTRQEAADLLDVPVYQVRNLIKARAVLTVEREGQVYIPEICFIQEDGQWSPEPALRGTLMALGDLGLDTYEARDWMVTYNEELGGIPLVVLHHGSIHSVRRAIISTAL
ncbi:MAG: Rv2175c family DNA-binding protein [Bowdeniella nasicola]|nr:Rv2175c family DNA-binding protein [Bowdeniella nasicola]